MGNVGQPAGASNRDVLINEMHWVSCLNKIYYLNDLSLNQPASSKYLRVSQIFSAYLKSLFFI